jgi:hypothetical protein
MADQPSSDFTEAVRKFFNEASGDLMSALFLIEQLRAEFDKEHYLKYEAINERYLTFIKSRDQARIALTEEARQVSTPDQKADCASHLLAAVEKHSEQMAAFAREFNEVIHSWKTQKPTP